MTQTTPKWQLIRRSTRYLIYGFLLAFILMSCILVAVTGTTSGSRLLITHLIQNNGAIAIKTINGSILHGLHVEALYYQTDSGDLSIEKLEMNWQPLALLLGVVKINKLQADKIEWTQNQNNNDKTNKRDITDGNLPKLPLAVHLNNVSLNQITINPGENNQHINKLDASIIFNKQKLSVKKLNIDSPVITLKSKGHIDNKPPYTLSFSADWRHSIDQAILLSGQLNFSGDLKIINIEHQLSAPHPATTIGHLDLTEEPNLVLESQIANFVWQDKNGNLIVNLKNSQLTIQGWLDQFTMNADTKFNLPTVQNASLMLTATGDLNSVKVSALKINSEDKQLSGYGVANINLKPALTLKAGGSFKIKNNTLSFNTTIDDTVAADWQLKIPNLYHILPAFKGSVTSSGSVTGTLKSPNVQGALQAQDLQYNENYFVENINANAVPNTKQRNNINITVDNIRINQQAIDKLILNIDGDIDQHRLSTKLMHSIGELDMTLNGRYQKPNWQAQINQGALKSKTIGNWQLKKPITLFANNASIKLDQHCWQNKQADFCSKLQFNQDNGVQLSGKLNQLPLSIFNQHIGQQNRLIGTLGTNITITGPLKSFNANAELNIPAGAIVINSATEKPIKYGWENIELTLEGKNAQNWQAQINGKLLDKDSLNGEITINHEKNLDGTISASLSTISWLAPFIPALDQLKGKLNTEANISGSMQQPQLSLNAKLSEGSMSLPALGIDLHDVSIEADSQNKDEVALAGTAKSEQGHLSLNGSFNRPLSPDWQMQLKTSGQNFQIVNLSQFKSTINPKLALMINRKQLEIQGGAFIPTASIDIKTLPAGAIDVSPDTIEINARQQISQQSAFEITSQIELTLGDKIQFQGFGFSSRLGGQLQVSEKAGQIIQAFGELRLLDGRYKAYGQKLTIEENSKLIFQGSLENPALSVRATRQIDEVTVGLELGGTLKKPRSRLFSVPTLPETEIAAILVTGKSLSSASETDASAIVNAIASWGLERGGTITQSISDTFKLDILTIDSQQSLEQSSLLLGKYLTPRLLVKYAIGLFEQSNTLGLEYQLNKKLKLEAQSGTQRSIDLIYNIER